MALRAILTLNLCITFICKERCLVLGAAGKGFLWRIFGGKHVLTTPSRWFIFRVKARLNSSAFGNSTGLAQFSSVESRGSAPPFVTQGCA
jgi:hypothetical protein